MNDGKRATVAVLGSLNVDSTSYVERFPEPGETIASTGFAVALGGKGTNQAVAAHVAGATVELFARVGADAAGEFAIAELTRLGLSTQAIEPVADRPTGVAQITVTDRGENTVIVSAGANAAIDADTVDARRGTLQTADIVLTQGEIPVPAIIDLAERCEEYGVPLMINLAPPVDVPAHVLAVCDPLVVNEHEAVAVGIVPRDADEAEDWATAAREAVGARCRSIVITLGARGAVGADASGSWFVAAPRATAVDTTGAGDCFTGTLAAMLSEQRTLVDAARIAVAAATLSVQRAGTVGSYAGRDEVLRFAEAEGLA